MEKLSKKGLLAIAVLVSLVTASMVYIFLQSATQKVAKIESESVVVAKINIPAKTRISVDMLQETSVPLQYVQPGALKELPKVVGSMTREDLIAGEQMVERRLWVPGAQSGFSGVIPAGKRALTVAASEVTGVAGLVKAGDYVDVLITFDAQTVGDAVTQIAMQNIPVLSVNRDSLAGPDKEASRKEPAKEAALAKVVNITLAVTPEDAARITMAEEKGKVRFALRPYATEKDTYLARPVSPADIVGNHLAKGKTVAAVSTGNSGGGGGSGNSSGNSLGIPVIRGTKFE